VNQPSLFGSPGGRSAVASIDGGSRGNPGPAGYGVVITDRAGKKVAALHEYLGHQTNNYAEYQGLLAALDYALAHGHKGLKVVGDSELLVKQIRGEYKVKSPALQDLYQRARQLISQLEWFSIQHTLREGNQEADRLANMAMDKGMGRSKPVTTAALLSERGLNSVREFSGVVRNGVIIIEGGKLPDGTRVQIRVREYVRE
jgi:ribonuclease HI